MILLSKHRWILHLAYWIVSLAFLSLFFGRFNRSIYFTFLFAIYQLPIIIATTYIINYWLIPKFLFKKQYLRFIYFLCVCIVISIWLIALITVFVFIIIYKFDPWSMPVASFDFFFLTAGLYLIVLIGVVIHLVRESFKEQEWKYRLQEKQIETNLKLKESKLKLLQGQLHPHLLFNSLNTIYGFSLQKSEKAPSLIINLSSLLDYMLYHCDVERISLEKEFEFLNDFIEIEKHKFGEDLNLEIKWPEYTEEYLIAPLILLPFCENCFKHSKDTGTPKSAISINSKIEDNSLFFSAINTFDPVKKALKSEGVGIQNVRERLNLIYPDNHELNVLKNENNYQVELKIKLDKIVS